MNRRAYIAGKGWVTPSEPDATAASNGVSPDFSKTADTDICPTVPDENYSFARKTLDS